VHLPYTRLLRGKIQGLRRRFKRIASVHKPPGGCGALNATLRARRAP
jgi:hypothetical protein